MTFTPTGPTRLAEQRARDPHDRLARDLPTTRPVGTARPRPGSVSSSPSTDHSPSPGWRGSSNQTGHFRRDTTRRSYDTGIVIHEIIAGGVDSPRGQRMVRLMNALHDRPDIHAEDMTYILNALIVVPTRFMNTYGWRHRHPAERTATWRFYDTLGDRMGIHTRPTSYDNAEEMLDHYEQDNLAPSREGSALSRLGPSRTAQPTPPTRPAVRGPAHRRARRRRPRPPSSRTTQDQPVLANATRPQRAHDPRRVDTTTPTAERRRRSTPASHPDSVYPHGYTSTTSVPSAPSNSPNLFCSLDSCGSYAT